MSDHSGLRYLFDQPNMNGRQARWLATISEFNFKIECIKAKENRVENALSRWIQVNHLPSMSSQGIDLQDRILQASQKDVKYMDIVNMLQQSTGTCTSDNTGTCIGDGTGTSVCAYDMDYCLTTDRLVKL